MLKTLPPSTLIWGKHQPRRRERGLRRAKPGPQQRAFEAAVQVRCDFSGTSPVGDRLPALMEEITL